MNKQTVKALKGSIQKWHDIAYYGGYDNGTADCPLCQVFYEDSSCRGCPVYKFTKVPSCADTPYDKWRDLCIKELLVTGPKRIASNKDMKQAAIAELKFLVCLLPEGEEAEMTDGWVWYWK